MGQEPLLLLHNVPSANFRAESMTKSNSTPSVELRAMSSGGSKPLPSHDDIDVPDDERLIKKGHNDRALQYSQPRPYRRLLALPSLGDALFDIAITICSIYFLVFSFIVWQQNQSPIDGDGEDNSLLQAAKFVGYFHSQADSQHSTRVFLLLCTFSFSKTLDQTSTL